MATTEDIFTRQIRENSGIIYKVCNSYCANKDHRDDLAQEIIYNLWKSFPSYDPAFKFSTWMYRVALNVAISYYRQETKFQHQHPLVEGLTLIEENTEAKQEEDANLGRLYSFINELQEIDKAIILLYLDNNSHREISEITGFTETNVATRINRIKTRLKTKFTDNINSGYGTR